jgi:hypothetical protein
VPQTSDPAKKHHVVGHELLTAAATVDSDTGATILTVTGEAHLLTAPVSHRRLDEHFGANRAPITVDLSRGRVLQNKRTRYLDRCSPTRERRRPRFPPGREDPNRTTTTRSDHARRDALHSRRPAPGTQSSARLSDTTISPQILNWSARPTKHRHTSPSAVYTFLDTIVVKYSPPRSDNDTKTPPSTAFQPSDFQESG